MRALVARARPTRDGAAPGARARAISAEGGTFKTDEGDVTTMTLESADLNTRTVTYRYGGTRKDGSLQQGYEVVSRDFIEKRVPRFTVRLERQ